MNKFCIGKISSTKEGLQAALLVSVISALAGCGGSNSSSGTTPAPALETLSLVPIAKSMTTSEMGSSAEFTLALDHKPAANVTFTIQSSDIEEATVSTAEVIFTPSNWEAEQTIVVTGINDLVADGDQAYTVKVDLVTGASDLADSDRERLKDFTTVEVEFTNLDIVPLDLVYTVSSPTISELGTAETSAILSLALNHQPEANIKFTLQSSNINEAVVDLNEIEFTTENWAAEQTVTVSGINDFLADGDQAFNVTIKLAGELTDLAEKDQKRLYIFANKNEELTSIDIGTPVIGKLTGSGGIAWHTETKGAFTYVAKGAKGLEIYYSLDPDNVYLVGRYETLGSARGLYLSPSNEVAYVADYEEGLFIIDVANPAQPSLIGHYETSSSAIKIAVSVDETVAVIGSDGNGVKIIDLSNSENPILVGRFDDAEYAYDVEISTDGNTAYIVAEENGFYSLDISDKANPQIINNYTSTFPMYSLEFNAAKDVAFIAGENRIEILDVSDQTSPVLISGLDSNKAFNSLSLSANEKDIYLTGWWDKSFDVVNISDLANPEFEGGLTFLDDTNHVNITLDANKVWVAAKKEGLVLVDITDALNPVVEAATASSTNSVSTTLSTNNQLAFIADATNGLFIIDVSNQLQTKQLATFLDSGPAFDVTLSADNNTAFVSHGANGVNILNITDPSKPLLISTIDTPVSAIAVALSVDENTLYIADGNTVEIYNISDNAQPALLTNIDTPNETWGIDLVQNTLFVSIKGAANNDGFIAYDISNVNSITKLGSVLSANTHSALGVDAAISPQKNIAYLANGTASLRIVDIADPSDMKVIGGVALPTNYESAFSVAISLDSNTAYLTTQFRAVMHIVDVSDVKGGTPASISSEFINSANRRFEGVTISNDGNTAYLSDGKNGLRLMDVSDPASPQ